MGFVKYKTLFGLRILNTFYTSPVDGNKDFEIIPSAECAGIIRDNKLVFRNTPEGSKIFFAANEADQPIIPIDPPGVRMSFVLRLLNKGEFFNFTDLTDLLPVTKTFQRGNLIYFRNIPNATVVALDYEILDRLSADVFTYKFSLAGTPS